MGPAVGASAAFIAPGFTGGIAWAVGGLLMLGFVLILFLRFRHAGIDKVRKGRHRIFTDDHRSP